MLRQYGITAHPTPANAVHAGVPRDVDAGVQPRDGYAPAVKGDAVEAHGKNLEAYKGTATKPGPREAIYDGEKWSLVGVDADGNAILQKKGTGAGGAKPPRTAIEKPEDLAAKGYRSYEVNGQKYYKDGDGKVYLARPHRDGKEFLSEQRDMVIPGDKHDVMVSNDYKHPVRIGSEDKVLSISAGLEGVIGRDPAHGWNKGSNADWSSVAPDHAHIGSDSRGLNVKDKNKQAGAY